MGSWQLPPLPRRWSASSLPPFVGRQQQSAVLEDVWRCVEAGARQVVFAVGEAGAGKSRLASEAAVTFHPRGVTVLLGACVGESGSAFDPFVEPLASLVPGLESGAITLPGVPHDFDVRLDLLRLITGRGNAPGPLEGVHQSTLFTAATDALVAVTAVTPVLLVLEDLHWAGEDALKMLRFAVERTADVPILFLVTLRTEPQVGPSSAARVLADLMRLDGVRRLDLPGLDTDAIAEYLVRGAGVTLPQARRMASLVRDQTAGNPFLVREVCRDWAADLASGDLGRGAVPAPEAFRESTRTRLEQLSSEQRTFVETAAVIGEEFDVPLVTAACRQAASALGPDPSPHVVFVALDAAHTLGLVEWVPSRNGVGRFQHSIARQAVLDLMTEYDRAVLNSHVAVALEHQFPAADRRVQRLATHYSNAAGLGFADLATDYLEAAADEARTRLSHADAAELYERAAAHATAAARRDDLRLAAGRAHLQATDTTRARDLAELVAGSGTAGQRLQAAFLHEAVSWRANTDRTRSIELLTAALERGGGGTAERDRITATAALGRALSFADRTGPSAALSRDAIRSARDLGDQDLLAKVLAISLLDGSGVEHLPERLQRADELTNLVGQLDDVEHLGPAAFHRCVCHYVLGDPAALAAAHLDLARMARATNEPYWVLALNFVTFGMQLMRCEFTDAAATLKQTAHLGGAFAEGGYREAEGPWSLQSFMLRRETDRLAPVGRLLTGDEDPRHSWAPGLLALYTELGMAEPTRRVLWAMLDEGLDMRQRSASWPAVLSFLVDAAVWLEDRDAAGILLPLLGRFAGRNLLASEFLVALGSGDRLIGALESVRGELSAEDHFVAALEMDTRMGSPLHQAATLAEHVAHLRRAGGQPAERVARLTAEALALCDRHGLPRVRRRIEPATPAAGAEGPGTSLTPRETEVLRLLGRGLSNREIATTLVISEYTATNHVRNILSKLQCTNRTQAAMLAVDLGLTAATQSREASSRPAAPGAPLR